jgi:TolA-binding protein
MGEEQKAKQLIDEGIKLARAKRLDQAIEKFRRVTVFFADTQLVDNAHYNLGMIYEQRGDHQLAYVEYKTILDLYPDSDAAYFATDKIEELRQKADEAANLYFEGESNFAQGKLDRAEACFKALIEHFPASTLVDNAHFGLGMIYLKKKDRDKAISHFDIVKTEFPDSDAAKLIPDILEKL